MSIALARRGSIAARRRDAGDIVARIMDATTPPTSTSWIERVSADRYYLWQPFSRGEYVRNEMRRITSADMADATASAKTYTPPIALWSTTVHSFAKSITYDATSIAYTGTWLGSTSRYSATVGDSLTWTTPANTVGVSIAYTQANNRGFARVLIDGDPTAANQLDTAQQAVDKGHLPAAALVANGGTLAPTDRVLDQYALRSATFPEPTIASDLPAGVHTVTLQVTGYKRSAASEARVTINGFSYIDAAWDPTTPGTTTLNGAQLRRGASVQESAYRFRINTVEDWCGGTHGNLTGTSESITVDGTPTTMGDGQVLRADTNVIINTAGTFHHPETGATPIGNVTRTYTLTGEGLRIQHSTAWTPPTGVNIIPNAAYPAMMTLTNSTDQRWGQFSKVSGSGLDHDVTAVGSETRESLGRSATIWHWTPGGHHVAIASMTDAETTLQDWEYAGPDDNLFWSRTLTSSAKSYWTLCAEAGATSMPALTNSDVWAADTLYRWAYVTDADAVASRA